MLRDLRLRLGLTQGEMVKKMTADGLKVTVPMLSLLESGQVNPPEDMADWIARQSILTCEIPMSAIEENLLLRFRETDAEHPITRAMLKSITGMDDRSNRLLIGDLRDRGNWIIDNREGYYLTHDEAELNEWLHRFSSYAYTILRRKRAMLANVEGQTRL